MNLLDVVQRSQPPIPWQEGDNIPWHEAGFSQRMLAEHLSQAHDLASRRSHIIDQHVAWIHEALLQTTTASVLDLGCGPGLYSNRLAALGHTCVGIDYSPASIAYAKDNAAQDHLPATYLHSDMRTATFALHVDLVMLLYGELNVFSRQDAANILAKAHQALLPGGKLLLEPHTLTSLIPDPASKMTWFSSPGGLFSPTPHLVLTEQHWDDATSIVTRRHYIIDAATNEVTRYAQSLQAYTSEQYIQLLTETGFDHIEIFPGLAHDHIEPMPELQAIVAHKPA